MTLIPPGPMRYQRGGRDIVLDYGDGCVGVWSGSDCARMSRDDLYWLCAIAGPALLNELAKDSPTTLDTP